VVTLRIAFVSDAGLVRENNEDAVAAMVLPEERTTVRSIRAVFVVADGMGGHAHGEVASRLAVDTVLTRLTPGVQAETATPAHLLCEALGEAHRAIKTAGANDGGDAMGTTAVVGIVVDDVLTLAHVGDSRAYLARRDEIRQLTEDHAWAAEQVRQGIITTEAAAVHPMRHYLTRSLGHPTETDADVIVCDPLQDGDVIVACTDGLTNHVSEDEILGCLHATSSAQGAAIQMTALAKERGGSDNITVLVMECGRLRRWPQVARARGIVPASRAKRPPHIGWAIAVVALGVGLLLGVGYHRGWWAALGPLKGRAPMAEGGLGHK
jgi:serine/threonine protein phosphatase PrpC